MIYRGVSVTAASFMWSDTENRLTKQNLQTETFLLIPQTCLYFLCHCLCWVCFLNLL